MYRQRSPEVIRINFKNIICIFSVLNLILKLQVMAPVGEIHSLELKKCCVKIVKVLNKKN